MTAYSKWLDNIRHINQQKRHHQLTQDANVELPKSCFDRCHFARILSDMQGLHGLGSLLQPRRGEDAIWHCLLVTSASACLRNGQRREFDDFERMIGISQWGRTKPLVSGSWFFVWNYESALAILLVCMWFRRPNPTYLGGSRFSHRGATATRPGSHRIHRRIWFLYCRWFMLICLFWDKCLIHFEYRSPVEIFILPFLKKKHVVFLVKDQDTISIRVRETDQGTTRETFQFLPCQLLLYHVFFATARHLLFGGDLCTGGGPCLSQSWCHCVVLSPSRIQVGSGKNSGKHIGNSTFFTHILWMTFRSDSGCVMMCDDGPCVEHGQQ